jgi:hypothetical protein
MNKTLFEKCNDFCKTEINPLKNDYTKDKSIQLFNEKSSLRKIINKSLRTTDIRI